MNLKPAQPGLWCGVALLGALALGALLADFIAPYDPTTQHRAFANVPPGIAAGDATTTPSLQFFVTGEPYRFFGTHRTHLFGVAAPARVFVLGTDALGRDVWARVWHSARRSLTLAAAALLLALPLALGVGCVAGYFGGAVDFVCMRLIELFLALPALYLVLALRSALPLQLPPERVFWALALVIALFGWAHLARVVRGQVLALREREFVLAARALGASDWRILRRHVLPHLTGLALTQAALAAPAYILAEVTLSYLGLGVPEPLPSWGNMLAAAQTTQTLLTYWWNLAPAGMVFLTSLAFQFIADGLQQRHDPRRTAAATTAGV